MPLKLRPTGLARDPNAKDWAAARRQDLRERAGMDEIARRGLDR
jgi:hypothetical protein